jgi:hypothetical protein
MSLFKEKRWKRRKLLQVKEKEGILASEMFIEPFQFILWSAESLLP